MKTKAAGRATIVKACTCVHPGMDRLHGRGMRVFNRLGKAQVPTFRCVKCEGTSTGSIASSLAGITGGKTKAEVKEAAREAKQKAGRKGGKGSGREEKGKKAQRGGKGAR